MQALKLQKSNDDLLNASKENSSEGSSASLAQEVAEIKAFLEGNSKSDFQIAGYASIDWTDAQGSDNEFSGVKFAPIFHYQYGNLFQFEGELEITIQDDGEIQTELEYVAGTLFLNDYVGLQMGKFMSPMRQFVQNLHSSWSNKLPSAPLGFGHDVASIVAKGKTSSNNANKTWGGRYAINPLGGMEIGASIATGEVSEDVKPAGGKWKALYAQASYQFNTIKIEPVIRYGRYENPGQDRAQWALGLNYLLLTISLLSYCMNMMIKKVKK